MEAFEQIVSDIYKSNSTPAKFKRGIKYFLNSVAPVVTSKTITKRIQKVLLDNRLEWEVFTPEDFISEEFVADYYSELGYNSISDVI